MPALLLERFARSPAVLCSWAVHAVSGEAAPRGLVEEALKESRGFRALDMQIQLLHSLADQVITIYNDS